MAFPSPATNGQTYTTGGYTYVYNSTLMTWTKVTTTTSTIGNVTLANGNVSTGNTTLTNNSITTNTVTTGNTTLSDTGLTTGNTTISNTSVTTNTVTTGNTTVNNTGVTVGNVSVTNNAVSTGNVTVNNSNIVTGNTTITGNSVTTGNVTINSSNIVTGNTTINNNSLTTNTVTTGNTTVNNTGLSTGNTSVTGTSVTTPTLNSSNVTANGNVDFSNASNVNLGSVSNLHISGGTSGYVLQTDGSGALTWISPSSVGVGGSNSYVQFNDNGSFNGVSNFAFNKSTNTLSVDNITLISGNLLGGNLISGNYLTGTLTTASQPNITQLGILQGLDVSGNIALSAGNISGVNTLTATYVAGTLTTANQPNITNVGTLSNLTSNGTINFTNSSNVTLGVVGNLHIGGGTSGYVLKTDGAGNLSWISPTSVGVGGSNTQIQFNDNGSVAGNANLTFTKTTGTLATKNITLESTGNLTGGNLVSANYITGTLTTGAQSNITSVGTLVSLLVTGNVSTGNANLGNLATSNYFSGNGSLLTSITGANVNGDVAGANHANIADSANSVAGSNVTGQVANALIAGTVYTNAQPNITSVGTLTNLNVSGNVTASNVKITTLGDQQIAISSNGVLVGGPDLLWEFTNAALFTTALKSNGYITTTGNVTAANANLGNIVTANYITGTLTTGNQPNITTTGTLTDLTVSGNLTVSGSTTYVNVTTTAIKDPILELGGGTNAAPLTNNDGKDRGTLLHYYSGSSPVDAFIGWDNSNAEFAVGSNVSVSGEVVTFNEYGNIRANTFIGNVSGNISGTITAPGSNSQLLFNDAGVANANANLTFNKSTSTLSVDNLSIQNSGNVSGANLVSANYISGNGSLLTSITGANVTGQVGNSLIAGTVYTNAQPNITSTGTLNGLTATSTVNLTGASNVALGPVANVHITGGTTGQYLQTDGSGNLSWQTISTSGISNGNSNVNIPSANGNVNISAVGNANVLVVTGTGINVSGTLNATGNITSNNAILGNLATSNYFSGNGSLLTSITGGNVTGQVANALLAGTVYTNAQPNITSLGTLSSLTVTANISSGNANLGNLVTANYFSGDGYLLSNLNVGSIGTIANANYAAYAGNVVSASQPNITSVGTLASLSVSGNVTSGNFIGKFANGNSNINIPSANGNITFGVTGYPNIVVVSNTSMTIGGASGGNITGANVISATTFDGTLSTAAQPNITSTGTMNGLTATNNINFTGASNVALGAVGNVHITGGSSGYLLTTDGSGGLSWTAAGALSVGAAGSNTYVQYNNNGSLGAEANFYYNSTTHTLGTKNITLEGAGNLTGGNLVSANYVTGTLTTGSQPNITTTGTLTDLNVSGNLTVSGSTTYVNVTTTAIKDPIIEIGGGTNGAGLSTDDNKDRGTLLHYYSGSSTVDAFMGWDDSNAEFAFGSNVSVSSEVVTFNSFGNVRGKTFIGNLSSPGSNTQVMFNDSGIANATAGLTFNKSTNALSVAGNVSGAYILGNGYYLTGVDQLSVGNALQADIANSVQVGNSSIKIPVANGNIVMAVTGTNIANITNTGVAVTGTFSTSGNMTIGSGLGGTFTGANLISANYITGTLTSTIASQPNITAVGTLASLTVGPNSSVTLSGSNGYVLANAIYGKDGSATFYPYYNSVAGAGAIRTDLQVGAGSAGNIIANGNVSANNANLGNLVTANYFSGTVNTAAQPNITSVGTLNGITATGTLDFTGASNISLGNISNLHISGGTTGYILTTDGSGGLTWSAAGAAIAGGAAGTNTYVQFNDGNSFGADSNFYYDKSIYVLGVKNINVAPGGSVFGGNLLSANYVEGNGYGMTGVARATSTVAVANGTSNVNIPAISGNINLSAAGTANVLIVTSSGIVVAGSINSGSGNISSGNANLGNLVTANYFSGNGSSVTSVTAIGIANGTSNVTAASAGGNVTISVAGNANILTATGTGVNISGYLNTSGNITASRFIGPLANGTGSNVNVPSANGNVTISVTGTSNVVVVTSTGVNVAGTLNTGSSVITTTGNVSAGNANLGNLVTANYFSGSLLGPQANGNSNVNIPSANGNVNISAAGNANIAVVTGTGVNISGTLNTTGVTTLGNLVFGNTSVNSGALVNFNGAGNINLGNVANIHISGGNTGYMLQTDGYGNLSWVTATAGIAGAAAGINTNIQFNDAGDFGADANFSYDKSTDTLQFINATMEGAGTLSGGNLLSANYLTGTLTTAAQPNITSVGTLTSLNVSANVTAGNLVGKVANGNSNINIPAANGNVTIGVTGTSNVVVISNNLVNVAGNISANNMFGVIRPTSGSGTAGIMFPDNPGGGGGDTASIKYYAYSGEGTVLELVVTNDANDIIKLNATGGTQVVNTLSADLFSGNGAGLTNLNGSNITSQIANALVAGTVYTNAQPNITSVGTLSSLSVTGNVTAGNILGVFANGNSNVKIPSANGNITISAAGNANIIVVTGTGVNVAGTLNTGSGNANVGNLGVATVIATANISANNANLGNLVTANYITGTLTTGAQPNVTSVGTLDYLQVNGNILAGNAIAANYLLGTLVNASQPNITSTGTLSSLNVSGDTVLVGNLTVTGATEYTNITSVKITDPIVEQGGGTNGAALLSNDGKDRGALLHYHNGSAAVDAFIGWDASNAEFAVGSNVSVTNEVVTFNSFANLRANYLFGNATYLTGVATSAAADQAQKANTVVEGNQPNITSVGTLTTLVVSGNVTASSFISTVSTGTAPFVVTSTTQVANLNAATAGSATTAATVTTNAQPNITSVGTLSGLTSTGTINLTGASNVSLGSNTNVHISGGSNGQYLQTDGSGQLTWSTISTSSTSNGTSNMSIPVANGNIDFSVNGNANVLIVTGTGVNVSGTLNATGNLTVANIITSGNLVGNILGNLANGNSYVSIPEINGNVVITANNVANIVTVSTSGTIVSGNLTAGNLFSNFIGKFANGTSNVSIPYVDGDINFSSGGTSNVLVITYTGATLNGTLTSTGNIVTGSGGNGYITGANLLSANILQSVVAVGTPPLIVSSSTLVPNLFVEKASTAGTVYTAAQPNITSVGTLVSLTSSGNITALNANLGNLATANYLTGTLTTAAQPNITSVGTLSNLTSNGTVNFTNASNVSLGAVGNLHVTGGLPGYILTTNGSGGLSWTAAGSAISGGAAGSDSYVQYNDSGSFGAEANFYYDKTTHTLGTKSIVLEATGSLTGGNSISANYFSGNGSLLTSLTGGNVTGQVGNALVAGTVYTGAQPNITSVGTLSSLSVTTNGNITLAGTASQITGANLISASYLTGTLTTGAQPNITSVGTIQSVTMASNANITMSGTASKISGGNLLSASYLTGTLTTGAQANITSVGTMQSITMAAATSISGGNLLSANYVTGTLTTGAQPNITSVGTLASTTLAANANITMSGSLSKISGGNLVSASYLTGTLTTGAQANITSVGTMQSITMAAGTSVSGGNLLSANYVTGTLTTAAQPNITSLGTLSSLGVNGAITANTLTSNIATGTAPLTVTSTTRVSNLNVSYANVSDYAAVTVVTSGTVYPTFVSAASLGNYALTVNNAIALNAATGEVSVGTGSGGNITGANVISANTLTGTLTTAAQPNITSTGTLSNLTSNGTVNFTGASNVSLGAVGNLHISGGTSGYILTTDGSGGLSWTAAGTAIAGGAAGSNTQLQFNDSGSFGASANLTFNNSTKTLSTDNISASGNVTITGNLVVSGTTTTVNSNNVSYTDSIIELHNTSNSGPLSSDDGKDIGIRFHYYKTSDKNAFLGWANDSGYLEYYVDATEANGVISGTYGTFKATSYLSVATTGTAPFVVNSTTQVANLNVAFAGTVTTSAQPNITSVGTLSNLTVTGDISGDGHLLSNITGANITGQVGNALVAGTVYTNAQPNITSVGILTSLSVNGNISANNASLGNLASAVYFAGDGYQLSNITGGNVTGQVSNSLISGTVYTNAQPNITSVGTLTSLSVTGNITSGNITTGNITSTNAVLGNLATSNYFSGDGSLLTAITGANVTGTVGNATTATTAATVTTNAQPNITSVGTLTSLNVSGNISSSNANLGNLVVANYFSGDGGYLSNLQISTATVANANYANYAGNVINASQGNITSLGTLTDLTVSGNITSGNAVLGNLATSNYFSGDGSLLSSITGANVTGQVSNSLVSGTVYTNAQPNITSVGTLTSLSVSGNITSGDVIVANIISANYISGTFNTLSASQPNITQLGTLANLTVTGNITTGNAVLGNLASAVYFSGNGSLLTDITGSNIIGQVGNALIAGTVYTNAQPNITSVGTLTSLDVTGNATAGNIKTDHLLYANGDPYIFTTNAAGSDTYVQFNDSNSFAGNAGLTFNKTTTTLTANNFVATSSVNLGNVSNIYISGGISGQTLITDGLGNLTWGVGSTTDVNVDEFTGNGVQTSFTLSVTPPSKNYTFVTIGGISQPRASYSLSGSTISISSPVPNGAPLEVTSITGGMGVGAIITNDTSTNSNSYYPMMATTSSGAWGEAYSSNTKLYFNPSTGTLNATAFNSLSDLNKKTNLEPIENALQKVSKLTGYNFNFIDSNEPSAGLIAQEVAQVLPNAAKYNAEQGVMTLNYNGLTGLLVEAVKALTDRIEILESKLKGQ